MKIGRDLNDLAQELTRQLDAKQDYIADTRQVEVIPQDEGVTLGLGDVGQFGVTRHTHRQLGDRCGIPARYYDRMLVDSPDLLAHNVNHWLKTEPENRMIRTLDGNARAFLSDRYRPLDNYMLADSTLPVLTKAGAQVVSCDITEKKFYLKAILPGEGEEIGPPDVDWEWGKGHHEVHVVQPGICISNSEVGAGALAVQPAIHTVHCTNLTVWNDAQLRKYHIGRNNGNGRNGDDDGIFKYMSDETKIRMDAAVWSQVADLVQAALTGAVFQEIVTELRSSRNNPIEASPVKAVEALNDYAALTEGERDGVLTHLTQGGDLSQYGLHQAVTRTAEDVEDYDRASDLELLGGKIVRLPANDWQRIARAA